MVWILWISFGFRMFEFKLIRTEITWCWEMRLRDDTRPATNDGKRGEGMWGMRFKITIFSFLRCTVALDAATAALMDWIYVSWCRNYKMSIQVVLYYRVRIYRYTQHTRPAAAKVSLFVKEKCVCHFSMITSDSKSDVCCNQIDVIKHMLKSFLLPVK